MCFETELKRQTHLINQFHDDQLQDVTKSVHLVDTCAEVIQGSILF